MGGWLQAAAQGKGGDPAGLGGQLQAPCGTARERLDLAQHRRQARLAQGLFHGPEPLALAGGRNEKKTAGIEPGGQQARPVEVVAGRNPNDRPCPDRQQALQEQQAKARRRAVIPVAPRPFQLVQHAQRQTAGRQTPVQGRRPEGQAGKPRRRAAATLEAPNLGFQAGKNVGVLLAYKAFSPCWIGQ